MRGLFRRCGSDVGVGATVSTALTGQGASVQLALDAIAKALVAEHPGFIGGVAQALDQVAVEGLLV